MLLDGVVHMLSLWLHTSPERLGLGLGLGLGISVKEVTGCNPFHLGLGLGISVKEVTDCKG